MPTASGTSLKIDSSISKSNEIYGSSFPIRVDYESYLLSHGYIDDAKDAWSDPKLVTMIQQHWHHTGQNGCVFAQSIAYKREEIGWESDVIYNLNPETLNYIDNRISVAISSLDNEVLSLLFPNIITPEQLVVLIVWLSNVPCMNIEFDIPIDDYTIIGLRIPLGNDGEVQSWLVGFAPMDYLPNTRQSPITEIAIRTKLKHDKLFHRLNQNKNEAHLADVQLDYSEDVMEKLWQATKARTSFLLGGEVERRNIKSASAKVTIAVPTDLWISKRN